jgi:hypothetical protein
MARTVLNASAMRASLLVAVLGLGLAACGDDHTVVGYASASSYQTEITDCIEGHDCSHLCTDVIKVPQDELDQSRILKHDMYGAKFACQVAGPNTSFPGGTLDDAISWDDDDNSCDDCDDASSGDDNSGDNNSGDTTSSSDSSTSDSSSDSDNSDDCSTSGGTTWFCAFAALGVVALRRRS